MPKIGIVAGEASGDLLGSHLMAALQAHRPDLQFIGIAGPKMQAQGATTLYPMERLAVRGFFEVLRHYWGLHKIRRSLKSYFLKNKPDLFIGIDAPDFNLGLERALRRKGIKTLHYVSPSVWAWRKGRIKNIGQAADEVLCLFPFEKPIYDQAGIAARYVGHPMADSFPLEPNKAAARAEMQLTKAGLVIALLPGSRQSELHYLADLLVETAQRIHQQIPDAQFLVPLISRETRIRFEQAIARHQADATPLRLLFGHASLALAAADGAIVASGTATLEAALLGCPMVITYKMSRLSWPLMKRMGYLPWVGLPNILAGKTLVPECLQAEATPQALSDKMLSLLFDRERVAELKRQYQNIHRTLRQDTAQKAAHAVLARLDA